MYWGPAGACGSFLVRAPGTMMQRLRALAQSKPRLKPRQLCAYAVRPTRKPPGPAAHPVLPDGCEPRAFWRKMFAAAEAVKQQGLLPRPPADHHHHPHRPAEEAAFACCESTSSGHAPAPDALLPSVALSAHDSLPRHVL